jgi:hypothetical protein
MNLLRSARQAWRLAAQSGTRKAIRLLSRRAFERVRGTPGPATRDFIHPFDVRHSVDTSGLIAGIDLSSGHRNDIYNLAYFGIPPSVFRQTFDRWRRTLPPAVNVTDYTFVDAGAGKGRAVLLASELPFRQVIGIELNAGLVKKANQNVATWQREGQGHAPMLVIEQDATDFVWPLTPLLVYLFNPFSAKVLEKVVKNLLVSVERHPRPVDLVYIRPEFRSVIERFPSIQLLWSQLVELSSEDREADAFGTGAFLCDVWRLPSSGLAFSAFRE